ncbi:MAG TPA: DsrE family protein [Nitrospiria bacterium]
MTVWLQNEAVVMGREGIADSVVGIGIPPLKDVLSVLVEGNVPFWVCQACAVARKITKEGLI